MLSGVVGRPEFVRLVQSNDYHWAAKVTFSRLFESSTNWQSGEQIEYKKVVLTINVEWKAKVRSDGRFFDCQVTGDNVVNSLTEPSSDDDLESLGVQKNVEPPL